MLSAAHQITNKATSTQSMSEPMPGIRKIALGQCSYNQPNAVIAAHQQFMRQKLDGSQELHLIIVDSSPQPSAATAYYEHLDYTHPDNQRVHYFHVPARPGHENEVIDPQWVLKFPRAYCWMKTSDKFSACAHELWSRKLPTDKVVLDAFMSQEHQQTLEAFAPNFYPDVVAVAQKYFGAQQPNLIQWQNSLELIANSSLAEFANLRGKFMHDRPHLGSKRNFLREFALTLGCDAVVHLDDDFIGPRYVADQVKKLENADFTAITHYPVFIQTPNMAVPIFGVCDQNREGNVIEIDFHGNFGKRDNQKKSEPMGFTFAYRIHPGMPDVPHILWGEDRALIKRLEYTGHKIYVPNDFFVDVVRGVFGNSNSVNRLTNSFDPFLGEGKLPNLANLGKIEAVAFKIMDYYHTLMSDFGLVPAKPLSQAATERALITPYAK